MSLDLCLKQLHVVHIKVFLRMQYIRLLLLYSVIFQSCKFQSCKFSYSVRYVTHNPFDVNDDVIFPFTFAVILKPNIEVTSSTLYIYENFLSFDSSDHICAYIYARFFARKKVL